jgi:hypothetical protein
MITDPAILVILIVVVCWVLPFITKLIFGDPGVLVE